MKTFIAVICLSVLPGCGAVERVDQNTCKTLAETYFSKPIRQAVDDLTKRPLPEQYEIYICGTQHMEPPRIQLATPFASQGAPAAAFLKERLAATTDALTIRDILQVFTEMKRMHTYDVRADAELMAVVKQKATSVTGPWHDYIATLVAELER
jgi:hypothetical protein